MCGPLSRYLYMSASYRVKLDACTSVEKSGHSGSLMALVSRIRSRNLDGHGPRLPMYQYPGSKFSISIYRLTHRAISS